MEQNPSPVDVDKWDFAQCSPVKQSAARDRQPSKEFRFSNKSGLVLARGGNGLALRRVAHTRTFSHVRARPVEDATVLLVRGRCRHNKGRF